MRPIPYYLLTSAAPAPGGAHGLFPALSPRQDRPQRNRDWPSLRLRPAAFGYVTAVPLAASAALVVAAARTPVSPGLLAKFLALLLCGLASVEATRRIDEPQGTLIRDLLTVWCLPIAVLLRLSGSWWRPCLCCAFAQWHVRRGVVAAACSARRRSAFPTAAHRSPSIRCPPRSAGSVPARPRTRSAGLSRSPHAT